MTIACSNVCLCNEGQKSNFRPINKGKFYDTPINMSVLVHQINKLIVKSVIF